MKTPTFGKREETLTYQTRYAAYIIVSKPENNTMVLVQAPNGAYFYQEAKLKAPKRKKKRSTEKCQKNQELVQKLAVIQGS